MFPRSLVISSALTLCLSGLCPIQADDSARVNLTADIVATATTLSSGASRITTIEIGSAEAFTVDWSVTPASGSANLQLQFRSGNSSAGPFTYTNSRPGTVFTQTIDITTTSGNTNLNLTRTKYVEVTQVNNAVASVTMNRITLGKY